MVSTKTPMVGLTVAALAALAVGCANSGARPFGPGVDLRIPDREWDPERPIDVGWCGETCIQMAMAYFGKEVPQAVINKAGRPAHPDLYEQDIDTALHALSVNYVAWDRSNHDVHACIAWIVRNLRERHPVICGVKIYPDRNPTWAVDHFALAVGFNDQGLLMNTNTNGQKVVPYKQLASQDCGYSFRNKQDEFYVWAVTGLR